jgi:hypothetical protein
MWINFKQFFRKVFACKKVEPMTYANKWCATEFCNVMLFITAYHNKETRVYHTSSSLQICLTACSYVNVVLLTYIVLLSLLSFDMSDWTFAAMDEINK